MRKFFKSLWIGISLLFKKSSEGMAASTGLAVAPELKTETENVVVQKQQDNYYAETLNKTFRQMQYDKVVKDNGIVENPYLEWDKLPTNIPAINIDPDKPVPIEITKEYLKDMRMSEERFKEFRKTLENKTKKKL